MRNQLELDMILSVATGMREPGWGVQFSGGTKSFDSGHVKRRKKKSRASIVKPSHQFGVTHMRASLQAITQRILVLRQMLADEQASLWQYYELIERELVDLLALSSMLTKRIRQGYAASVHYFSGDKRRLTHWVSLTGQLARQRQWLMRKQRVWTQRKTGAVFLIQAAFVYVWRLVVGAPTSRPRSATQVTVGQVGANVWHRPCRQPQTKEPTRVAGSASIPVMTQ